MLDTGYWRLDGVNASIKHQASSIKHQASSIKHQKRFQLEFKAIHPFSL